MQPVVFREQKKRNHFSVTNLQVCSAACSKTTMHSFVPKIVAGSPRAPGTACVEFIYQAGSERGVNLQYAVQTPARRPRAQGRQSCELQRCDRP